MPATNSASSSVSPSARTILRSARCLLSSTNTPPAQSARPRSMASDDAARVAVSLPSEARRTAAPRLLRSARCGRCSRGETIRGGWPSRHSLDCNRRLSRMRSPAGRPPASLLSWARRVRCPLRRCRHAVDAAHVLSVPSLPITNMRRVCVVQARPFPRIQQHGWAARCATGQGVGRRSIHVTLLARRRGDHGQPDDAVLRQRLHGCMLPLASVVRVGAIRVGPFQHHGFAAIRST